MVSKIKSTVNSAGQAFWQIPLLLAMTGIIAIGVNHWRADGLSLVGDWSVGARFTDVAGDSMIIDLEDARRMFQNDTALFVDARPQSQYAEGHIRGALNLPWQEADRYFIEITDRLDSVPVIVTYCDGASCDLSHELALFLKEMGVANVRVLVNGWTVWQQASLPTEAGGGDTMTKEAYLTNIITEEENE